MTTKVQKLDHSFYVKFKDYIAEYAGLYFPEKKRTDLERAVLKGLSVSRFDSVDTYFKALVNHTANGEMDHLISLLTVGETYFYRDKGQFRLIQHDILPKLIADRMATTRRLKIWSAGCATGEEPYSIAIILRELIPYIDTWDTLVLGTDINRESLAKAALGQYTKWSFRSMPDEWLDRYFFVSSKNRFHISDAIKNRVSFDYLNLKDKVFPSLLNNTVDLDLIICRNVTIYFGQKTISELMDRFYDCLADGGWLLMGASDPVPPKEKFWARNHSGVFIYQKKSAGVDNRKHNRVPAPSKKIQFSTTSLAKKKEQKKPKEPSNDEILAECQALLEMGQPIMAADKLATISKAEPKSFKAAFLMAKAQVARGHLRQARKWGEQAIVLDKLNIKAYYLLSAIHQGLKDDDKAIDCLKRTIYLDKNFVAGHFSLGCLYQKQKRQFMASKAFKNVVRLMINRPKDEIVPETNGVTYGKLLEVAESNLKVRA